MTRKATWKTNESLLLHIFPSFLGDIHLLLHENQLVYSGFHHPVTEHPRIPVGLREMIRAAQVEEPAAPDLPDYPALYKACKEFEGYLRGERRSFSIPFTLYGTDFQTAVWKQLLLVPYGTTVTYSLLAARAGYPRSVRAAGSAVGTNPLGILVPCHRVLPAAGGIGNYESGPERKEGLLRLEGYLDGDSQPILHQSSRSSSRNTAAAE